MFFCWIFIYSWRVFGLDELFGPWRGVSSIFMNGGSGRNERSNVKGQNNIQTTKTLTGEKKDLQERILGWLTDENIEWAEGRDLND